MRICPWLCVGICVPIGGRDGDITDGISIEGTDIVEGLVVPVEEKERAMGMLGDMPAIKGAPPEDPELPGRMLIDGRPLDVGVLPRGNVFADMGILFGALVLEGVVPVIGSQFLSLFPQSGQVNSAHDILGGCGKSFWQIGQ